MTSATLADLEKHGTDLMLWCRSFFRHVTISIADAIVHYGAGRTVPSISARVYRAKDCPDLLKAKRGRYASSISHKARGELP